MPKDCTINKKFLSLFDVRCNVPLFSIENDGKK